jgi:ribosome-associated protein
VTGVPTAELRFEFVRSSGPGGQNVNKVATAVRLRFDVRATASLPEDVKERLLRLAGRRATAAGEIVIVGQRHRTQEANRADVVERLEALVEKARVAPRVRRATRPTRASKQRRLDDKRRRSAAKASRRDDPRHGP